MRGKVLVFFSNLMESVMNKFYRVIWSSTLLKWIVTSEISRGRAKSGVRQSVAVSNKKNLKDHQR